MIDVIIAVALLVVFSATFFVIALAVRKAIQPPPDK